MSQVYITFALAVSFSFQTIYGYPGDPTINGSGFRLQNGNISPLPSQFQANNQPQKQIYHTNNKQIQSTIAEKPRGSNITFSELVEAMKGPPVKEDQFFQTLGRDNDSPVYPSYLYGYKRPTYGPPSHHDFATPYMEPKTPLVKPDLTSLLHPVSAKASEKLSGLLGLVTGLMSSSGADGMTGIKGLLIKGILKPLLLAKGGIKALMTKILIPGIALLLINIEVLIIVWWLWEECPEVELPPPPPPSYNYHPYQKPTSNYGSYS